MDNIVYQALDNYFHLLGVKGYVSYPQMEKLLVLCFYKDFLLYDYRGLLSKEDYRLVEQALDCLYGTTCLIPYPDYLKMGKLYLGSMTELSQRLSNIENTDVLKAVEAPTGSDSDIEIIIHD